MVRPGGYATLSFLWMAAALAIPARGAPPERMALPELMRRVAAATDFQETAIAPNHRYVAWVQGAPLGNVAGSAIYLEPLDHGAAPAGVPATAVPPVPAERVSAAGGGGTAPLPAAGSFRENSIAWSPDSRSLAFFSDAESPGQMELYVMRMADRAVRRLTQIKGSLATPRWSRDGTRIAVLFTENATRELGPLAAVPASVGVVDEQIEEQRLMIVDATTGSRKVVSAATRYIYEYDWSPRGDAFAVTGAYGSGDNNWYVAELFTIDIASGAEHLLLKPTMQLAAPRWSPDGRWVAFIGGLMSDESIGSGDVYEIPSAGGAARNLTPALDGSAFSLAWRENSVDLVVTLARNGGSAINDLNTQSGAMQVLWEGPETLRGPRDAAFGISLAGDGTTSAVIRESFGQPPSLWSGATGKWKRISSDPAMSALWGRAEDIRWVSDGFSVQGWLVGPATIDPAHKYPMVVWIHGGPAWLSAPAWPALVDGQGPLLANQGYFVFFPNPRGSAGFGERFTTANVKDVGEGPLRDILAGIRKAVASHPIDDQRIGLTGWSYGGYMTMWALTQTSRFRAAVAGAGVSDWLSYYGENGIDQGLIPYFGASVYDDPDIYAKSSPINFVKRVHTPTLIVVGDSDVECPPPQSYEYWHALKTFNVKTQLVVYPHEGHEFSDPAHTLDVLRRMVAWFDDNMPAGTGP